MSADCCTAPAQGLLALEQALERLMTSARPLQDTETVPIESALGRVLAAPVVSGVNVPPWANSAMDGYALNSGDFSAGTRLRVSQRIPAGAAPDAACCSRD